MSKPLNETTPGLGMPLTRIKNLIQSVNFKPRIAQIRENIVFFSAELHDLILLLMSLIVVIGCWRIFLHWHFNETIAHFDGLAIDLPIIEETIRAKGEVSQLIYRPQLLGGTNLIHIWLCLV